MITFILIVDDRTSQVDALTSVAGVSLIGHAVVAARQFAARTPAIDARIIVAAQGADAASEAARWGAEAVDVPADDMAPGAQALAVLERVGAVSDDVVIAIPAQTVRRHDDIAHCWRAFRSDAAPSINSSGSRAIGVASVMRVGLLREHRSLAVAGRTVTVVPAPTAIRLDHPGDLTIAAALTDAATAPAFRIAGRLVGAGAPCFVIAEIGVNHDGRVETARRLIDAAAEAGADAVKFQTFDPGKLVAPAAPLAEYQRVNTGGVTSQLEMLRALILSATELGSLAEHARARNVMFLSTAFDEASADLLDRLPVPAFKIPSGEITNHGLLRHIARKGKPLLVSTGMSDMPEVAAAMHVIASEGAPDVALLHCVSDYPAAPEDCNLRAMTALGSIFCVPSGWSDHTVGAAIAIAAVAAGASILEKHITLDRQASGPDHAASLEPADFAAMVAAVRDVEAAMVRRPKAPSARESVIAAVARRSLHAARDLPAGHRLDASDLVALRPGTGLAPLHARSLEGRLVRRAVPALRQLSEEDLEPQP